MVVYTAPGNPSQSWDKGEAREDPPETHILKGSKKLSDQVSSNQYLIEFHSRPLVVISLVFLNLEPFPHYFIFHDTDTFEESRPAVSEKCEFV